MNCYLIDPLADPRYNDLVEKHPSSSVFHTSGWLKALKRTYRFEPAAITTSPPGQTLSNSIVFCRVRSWLTGRRLVSLPFSDHCAPLVNNSRELAPLLEGLCRMQAGEGWGYVEIRPVSRIEDLRFAPAEKFCLHVLDLRPNLDQLSASFHKDCVLRKIRRAGRDGLDCAEGNSEALLRRFYALQVQTRRRQKTPPQPYRWFKNLRQCLGERLMIWEASIKGRAIAGLMTIRHGRTIFYKYGCSDQKFSAHGGTQMLFWQLIRRAKEMEAESLDLGRSDFDNRGLIDFKDRWGSARSEITYLKHPAVPASGRKFILMKKLAAHAPALAWARAGALFYRHFA